VLLGCALRRSDSSATGRWVFVDLVGKGKKIRTIPFRHL
jgi:hypothetical protein